ncbi:MAG: prepilin-type N-terminal cleavage/methylation domain-containing protein [Candidatus Marinimicrobia bacterium]|nr:prepilin-type N-terminal cleavage/methylation domain-containing protein [Candidatus Neomarinimicrobiota bacterium]
MPCKGHHNRGFTLVEVLAAMTILAMLVVFIGQIFVQATNAWQRGTRQVESDGGARNFLNAVAQRLSMAAADEILPFYLDNNGLQTYGRWSSRLGFVHVGDAQEWVSSGSRYYTSVEEMIYYIGQRRPLPGAANEIPNVFEIRYMQQREATKVECYTNATTSVAWFNAFSPPSGVTGGNFTFGLENVARFQVFAHDGATQFDTYLSKPNQGNRLPLWVDIYLEILSNADATTAKIFADAGNNARLQEFIQQRAKRYSRRVYFQNRNGYGGGR